MGEGTRKKGVSCLFIVVTIVVNVLYQQSSDPKPTVSLSDPRERSGSHGDPQSSLGRLQHDLSY